MLKELLEEDGDDILNSTFSNVMSDLVSDINAVCMYLTNFDRPLVDF